MKKIMCAARRAADSVSAAAKAAGKRTAELKAEVLSAAAEKRSALVKAVSEKKTAFFAAAKDISPKNRKKIRRTAAIALALVVIASSTPFVPVVYAVSYEGQEIGYVSSKEDAQQIIDDVEYQASEILGENFSLEDRVSVTSVISGRSAAENDEMEKIVLDSVEEIEELYGVYIDGELVAAVKDEATVDSIVSEIVAEYEEDDAYVSINESVATKFGYVPSSLRRDAAELRDMLDPENEESEYALSIKKAYIVREETITPFETETVSDSSMYEGQSKVIQNGVDGVSVATYAVVEIDGVVVENTLVSEKVETEVVNKRVAKGTKERPSTISYGSYMFPTNGQISSYFGYRNVSVGSSYHQGLDIWGSYGQAIWAADGGEVTFAGWNNGGYGYLVVIRHDNGEETYYAHCSSVAVSVGERVFQGQTIAYMGATGTASGVHVHFEVRVGGTPVDPLSCLK